MSLLAIPVMRLMHSTLSLGMPDRWDDTSGQLSSLAQRQKSDTSPFFLQEAGA